MLNLNQLYKITSNSQLSFEQKLDALLRLGLSYFKLDIAIISEIQADSYTVCHVISPDNALLAGTIFPLQDTYCVHTLATNQPLSFHNAGASHIAKHPCYINFGLESYIGAPLLVEGKRYGTINFSSSEPRPQPFSQEQHDFIELLSHWTANEIARNEKLALLQEQQNKMVSQQKTLEQMGQLAGVGAWEVDLVKGSVYWSEVTRQIHEVDDDFVPELATAINFYKAGENRDRITLIVNKSVELGGHFSGEFEIVTQTGKAKWVATKGRAELENGQCVRLVGAFQDITEQVYYRDLLEKRHKELSLALEARSLFLANMSHEIRTPINGVLGMLQILEASTLNHDQQHFLSLAKDSATSLLGIISDILDFTKIDSGKLNLEKHPVDLNKLLNNCIDIFNPRAKDKSISIVKKFAATDNIIAVTDPTRLRQICSNLVSNALKFTHQGQVAISTNIKQLKDNKAAITITVKDTGIGIAKEQLSRLFLPFSQADDSTTRKFGGTGLGLSIIKNLCQLMDGDVQVKSTPHKGSTFIASIVVELQPSQQADIENIELPKENAHIGHLRVLVVEDNEINQIVVGEMLKQQQIEFDVVNDGLEAIAKLAHEEQNNRFYSLILMDCQMPNMDGYEATRQIRLLTAPIATTPIIALTANALEGEREKCYACGMNDYLSKPIEQTLLYNILEKYA
jgi:signal transduction histidine kinase/CheY-like chemotaxis protein